MNKLRKYLVPIVVAAVAIALGLFFFADLVAWFSGETAPRRTAASRPASRPAPIAHYTCAMHPSVKQSGPGSCPICSMDLTPVAKHEVETGTILVDEIRRQRIGVRTEPVTRRHLKRHIRTVGSVTVDETRLHDVNLRMSGWVQKLLVDETGQAVTRGQTLFLLYSPELYAGQIEHLSAMRRSEGHSKALTSLARASRQRLRLLGLDASQIAALEKRGRALEHFPIVSPAKGFVIEKRVVQGDGVEAGTRVYRIADLDRVWVDAEIYESDLAHVRVGQVVEVRLPHAPHFVHTGRVDYVHPALVDETRTGRVRIVLPNPKLELKPDMYANVEIEIDLGEHLAVFESAVVYTGPRRLVFVDLGEGRLRPQIVKLGARAGDYYAVISGLDDGDVVVTSGNFLIAAESRIRSAAKYWETSDGTE